MALKKNTGKTPRPEKTEPAEAAPTAINMAALEPSIASNALDVFSAKAAGAAATTTTTAKEATDSKSTARELTGDERRMAERTKPSTDPDADHSQRPGSAGTVTKEQIEAMAASSGIGRQTARERMAAEQEATRAQLEDLNNGTELDGPNLGDFQRGVLGRGLGKDADDITSDPALGLTTGALQSASDPGSAADYKSVADGVTDTLRKISVGVGAAAAPKGIGAAAAGAGTSVGQALGGAMVNAGIATGVDTGAAAAAAAGGAAFVVGTTVAAAAGIGVGLAVNAAFDEEMKVAQQYWADKLNPEDPEAKAAFEAAKAQAAARAAAEAKAAAEAAAKAAAEAEARKKAEEEAKKQQSSTGQPEPDAVDPDAVLRWQAYLQANGMGPRDKSGDKVNPSPEDNGGPYAMPATGLRAMSKEDLIGQPAEDESSPTYNGDGSPNFNGRAGATDPPDDQTSEPYKGREEDEYVNTDPNQNNVEHLAPGSVEDEDDSTSLAKRYTSYSVRSLADDDD